MKQILIEINEIIVLVDKMIDHLTLVRHQRYFGTAISLVNT